MLTNLRKELASTCIVSFDAKSAIKTAWIKKPRVYEVAQGAVPPATLEHPCASYRTDVHKTLKQNRLALSDFGEFIECYKPDDRTKRRESRQLLLHCSNSSRPCESKKIDRWKSFTYDKLIARDKINLARIFHKTGPSYQG